MPSSELWLVAIVALAFAIEGALGFGATVIAVALGSFVWPIDRLLPAFVPLNMVLSLYLAVRYRKSLRLDLLFRRVLPAMLAGLPFGIVALARLPEAPMKALFGAFVVVLSALELGRRETERPAPPLSRGRALGLLAAGGVVHGAFATGGPLVVYVLGREPLDKASFRATLAALWLSLNVVLVSSYAWLGKIDKASLGASAELGLSLLVGLLLGELLHARVPGRIFRRLVFAMLGVAGLVILARALGRG
jgi:uncharacterized membrane protein YfcA